MNTISKLALRGKSYSVSLLIMTMLTTMLAMALDRASCAEPGAGIQDEARADPEVLAGAPGSLSQADYYGAIAYSQSSRRFGSAWSFRSRNEAEQRALASCNRADCKIVIWFKNACGSLARARNGAIAWSGGKDLVEAKRLTSNECTRRWGSCKLICSVCSRGDMP